MKWALHNILKGWTLTDLTDREVQLLVSSLSANEIRLTKIAEPQSAKWESLSEPRYSQFLEKINSSTANYPSLEQLKDNKSGDSDGGYFIIQSQKKVLPRLHVRHDLHVPCTINGTANKFQTTTFDVSEGGIQFEDIIPEWVAGYFVVVLHTPSGEFQLMCSLVEDQKEKKRVQIVAEDSDPQFTLFKEWLEKN